jgi:hypothetical protein
MSVTGAGTRQSPLAIDAQPVHLLHLPAARAAGVAVPELEYHADRAQFALWAAAWLHHGDGGSLDHHRRDRGPGWGDPADRLPALPDETALSGACSAHWASRQQLPDPGAWSHIDDPAARLRAGLADLYRFFRAGADMLTHIHRDFATLPEAHQQALRAGDTLFRDVLTAPFDGAD